MVRTLFCRGRDRVKTVEPRFGSGVLLSCVYGFNLLPHRNIRLFKISQSDVGRMMGHGS